MGEEEKMKIDVEQTVKTVIKPKKRKRDTLDLTEVEKESRIEELKKELDGLFSYFKEVSGRNEMLEEMSESCATVNSVIACLLEENDLPFSKLVEKIYEKVKSREGVTLASVRSSVLFVGQRSRYGIANADSDVLEDSSEKCLWCWEISFLCNRQRMGSAIYQEYTSQSQLRYFSYHLSVDWRDKGVLTPVTDHGNDFACCYADSSRAAIEGVIAIATGQLRHLSTKELFAPTYSSYNMKINPRFNPGEGGGLETDCFQYALTRGLSSDQNWPMDLSFPLRRNLSRVWIDGYIQLPPNHELLLRAIAQQPVVAALGVQELVDIGIISPPIDSSRPITEDDLHSVLLTGYDVTPTSWQLTFQNNWSSGWGYGGFGFLSWNEWNYCSLAGTVCYPVLDKFPSALNLEMEKIGMLSRRSPLGILAVLRFPYVLGGSFIAIKYKGVILSSGYRNDRFKPTGLHSVIGVDNAIWNDIQSVGGHLKNPVDVLECVIHVMANDCHN